MDGKLKILTKLFVLLVLLLNLAESQAKDRLLVVTDEWPPYVFHENQGFAGFDYEVMMAVFSEMGYEVNFQIYPWKRCIHMIETHLADAILDVGLTEARKKIMYFPEEKISESSSVLFHLKGKQYKYESLQDLQGLSIGTIRGYEYNKEFLDADYFFKEPVEREEQNFTKLILGRIDMVLINKNVGLYNAQKMGVLEEIDFIPKAVSGGDNFMAFSKKPGHAKLAEEFSDNLKSFKKTPAFQEILHKYGQ